MQNAAAAADEHGRARSNRSLPATAGLDSVICCKRQTAEGGNVGGVEQGVHQALQIAESILRSGVGLDCVVSILQAKT